MITIMQGDALTLPVRITLNGEPVTAEDVEAVRFSLGTLYKAYPGEVEWDAASGRFNLPLTQEETFALQPGSLRVIVRPKFKDSSIRGWQAATEIQVLRCEDKELM